MNEKIKMFWLKVSLKSGWYKFNQKQKNKAMVDWLKIGKKYHYFNPICTNVDRVNEVLKHYERTN